MSIRVKAILIIAFTLIVFIAALYTAAAAIMNQHTFAIEQLDTKKNVLRAKEAFLFEAGVIGQGQEDGSPLLSNPAAAFEGAPLGRGTPERRGTGGVP